MHSAAKFALALGTMVIAIPTPAQCGFQSRPIAGFSWYRSEGWPTPGVRDAKIIAPLAIDRSGIPLVVNGRRDDWPEGLTVSRVRPKHDYHFVFPSVDFEENGQHRQMQSASFSLVALLRWEMGGQPYAYTYTILSDTVACGFSMELIDDIGDGKFRVLKSPDRVTFSFPPLPAWTSKPKS
jgi:hypothetical protein